LGNKTKTENDRKNDEISTKSCRQQGSNAGWIRREALKNRVDIFIFFSKIVDKSGVFVVWGEDMIVYLQV